MLLGANKYEHVLLCVNKCEWVLVDVNKCYLSRGYNSSASPHGDPWVKVHFVDWELLAKTESSGAHMFINSNFGYFSCHFKMYGVGRSW